MTTPIEEYLKKPADYASLLKEALVPCPPNLSPGAEYAPDKRYFQGIPAIERSPGGRLWAAWYSGGQGESCFNYVILVTSGDDGETWSDPVLVIDPPGKVRACDEALWIDPEGRLWLFWMQSHTLHDGPCGVWAIVTDEPDKANPSWSAPRRLADGVMLNKPTVLSSGEWLLPIGHNGTKMIANEKRMLPKCYQSDILNLMTEEEKRVVNERAKANVFVSRDKGRTFTELGGVATPEEFKNHNEHMIVELKNRSLLMLVRTNYGIGKSISKDGGKNWSPVVESGIPHPASRFFLRKLKSGNLLLVKHGTMKVEDKSVEPAKLRRDNLTAYISDDDGCTWKGGLVLEERVCSYPDGVQGKDGMIYVIYDLGRRKEKMILMTRFTEDDVLSAKFANPRSRQRMLVNQATGVITEEISWERLRIQDGEKEKLIYTGI
ncbi:MAG TPA: sialidase family protein [Victivallales bacterium]|nr:sialidase family protein [Victivallales bacterium]